MILFQVSSRDRTKHVFVAAKDREEAKRESFKQLGEDPDRYVVTPLTAEGDQAIIKVNRTVQPVIL